MRKPAYRHDCPDCEFLGAFDTKEGERRDLYYCPRTEPGGSLVSRYGSEGPEYASVALDVFEHARKDNPRYVNWAKRYGLYRAYEIVKERKT